MSEKTKNYLGIAIIFALLIFAYAAVKYARAYADSVEPSTFRSFSVSGDGKVVAVPDIASVTFKVITQGGRDVGVLQKENSGKMNKAIDFVKSNNINNKDIKTESYNIEPRYQYDSCRSGGTCLPSEIIGYTITNSTAVKIRDFSKISDILSGVVKNGANSVSNVSFTEDDPEKTKNEARTKAIESARAKAEIIAESAGFRVGRLLSVDEGWATPSYKYGIGGATMEASSSISPAPSIEPGSEEVSISVNLRYEIK
ncbi:MAG: hypothetical protein A2430_01370 [Candidatus Liptonbacteria bacterium RIFOXYC1_FULL_36_8]|uniref:SIMPL domain-containing protein n=3 Tax=Candidatus Liptoniibacteriota TaxID=1817909 RepID=A0A1G2CMV7_9BACT|nr:MAG: hypothetical protein A2390_00500 [Candidatus Liptonbacteria bacterium RIFOXYB1_FULL_36_10]OGZ03926.1 MAG: hypothetical protein A2604_03140 [Candidatus Liptonbacteria bacterium RIFOXYD1_FULL_36_11]OGZ04344.1 MAG: hypothetical protein A2430_01370 [Candidatus Liptonbacteria bacterium RIFOXYC1_FULL_36_8]